ncbi:hypothetical protein ABIE13_003858 [Ottowia thiooxydans]|uniref:Uncharacterized protein n=1 Tax=Ottowia thiooxydans TaxID=219182 RepID=A0ABV2QDV7_9BURK
MPSRPKSPPGERGVNDLASLSPKDAKVCLNTELSKFSRFSVIPAQAGIQGYLALGALSRRPTHLTASNPQLTSAVTGKGCAS